MAEENVTGDRGFVTCIAVFGDDSRDQLDSGTLENKVDTFAMLFSTKWKVRDRMIR